MTGRDIAVIGGGISGLTAAYVLSRTDRVTLYEADSRLGGHANTRQVGAYGVDTGFIVHNDRTYPLLTRLFAELGVATQASEMSMSVRCSGCGLQYAGQRGLGGLAAGLTRGGTRYLRLLAEVPRFHRDARRVLAAGGTDLTFGEYLRDGGYSRYFIAHFALPLVAAVWSCPPGTAHRYPAEYLFRFFANHGMLSVSGSPQWRTVTGGSRRYVERAAGRVAEVRLSSPVRSVIRYPDGAEVRNASGQPRRFAAVVIATHPDQALRLLEKPTTAEDELLDAFEYTPNPAVLHTDSRTLPTSRAVRASWNYELSGCAPDETTTTRISYHMNRLQGFPADQDFIVTLNDGGSIPPEHVIARMDYAHPVYTPESVAAQRGLPGLNTGVTAFAGAYHGWGFHEDGCRSGLAAAISLGGAW